MRSRRMRRLAGFWMPRPEPIGSGQGHDGSGARVDQLAGGDEIVVGVGQDDKAFLDQHPRSFDELLGIREKGLLVADDFEFHPVGEADFTGQTGGANSLVGGVATCGVGQDEHLFAVDEVQQGFFGAVGEIHAADRDGDHIGARGRVGACHFGKTPILAGSHNQAGMEGAAGNNQLICHGCPRGDFRPVRAWGQILKEQLHGANKDLRPWSRRTTPGRGVAS